MKFIKMKFRTLPVTLTLLGVLAVTPGCKDFYDVNVDPLHPSVATEAQLLPGTQVALATYLGFSLEGLGQATSTLVGQLNSGRGIGTFQQTGGSFGNQWAGLYIDMLENNELIINLAKKNSKGNLFLGIAQLQKAYAFSEMADMWGPIPYSQALQGNDQSKPRYDSDRDIYLGNQTLGIQSLFNLIDEGIANCLVSGSASPGQTDLIYNGNATKWVKFGRTLKLKLYNQIRKVARNPGINVDIAAAVTPLLNNSSQLISDGGDDFELGYGTSIQPENRNISFLSNYVNPNREDVINQDFYQYMLDRKDPRVNYYFYNQTPTTVVPQVDFFFPQPTATTGPAYPLVTGQFVTVRLGSTGTSASAASADLVTLPGLYPAGGRYNDDLHANANFSFGRGTVAQRMLTTFNRYFIEAELQLTELNNPAAARAAFESGVREAFLKVDAIGKADGTPTSAKGFTATKAIPSLFAPVPGGTVSPASSYITSALSRYDAASSPDAKLNIVMQEKYVASFGFGEDIYTDFRRTTYPNVTTRGNSTYNATLVRFPGDVPQTISNGPFPTVLFYSSADLILYPKSLQVKQHQSSDIPFWMRF